MFRKFLITGLFFFAAIQLFSGGHNESVIEDSEISEGIPREMISDSMGNTIEVREYSRMVVLSPGAVETLYLIGAEDHIVAIGTSRAGIWPEDKTVELPSVGNLARPSLETIISYRPDLVILNGMTTAVGKDLSSRGIPVFMHSADSVEKIISTVLTIGKFSAHEKEAETLVKEKRLKLEELKESLKDNPITLKGAFLYSASPMMAFSEKTLPGEILSLLGVQNIAEGLDLEQPILSAEYVIQQNPDFLFCAMSITKVEDLLEGNPFIMQTRAGKEKNISIIPSSLFLRPSPRLVDILPELGAILEKIQ